MIAYQTAVNYEFPFRGKFCLQKLRIIPILYGKGHIPNIDAISFILILNSQCEEGARDGIVIWYMEITGYFNQFVLGTFSKLYAIT